MFELSAFQACGFPVLFGTCVGKYGKASKLQERQVYFHFIKVLITQ